MATSTPEQERYILHLNHALAMESALIEHLEKRAQQVSQPAARQRIQQHRQETSGHRERLRSLAQSLGATPTTSQAGVQPPISPSLTGRFKGALEGEKEDQLLLEALADYAVENYESALYQALARMAENLGFESHIPEFEAIREEEEEMARWIAAHEPDMVDEAFPPGREAA